jgi:NAD(P)-dependent dehydrogenase (short-subunit alcohol dehydrogenase family)
LFDTGIRVNNFSPGVADTPILDSQHETKEESGAIRAIYIKMTQTGPVRSGVRDGLGELQIKVPRSVMGSKA